MKAVEEDGESKEHWRPETDDEHSRPGEVHGDLLTEVVANLPQWLEATRLSPGTIQLLTSVLAAADRPTAVNMADRQTEKVC